MAIEEYKRLLDRTLLGKFLSVGAAGAIIDNFVLFLVVESLAISPTAGKLLSAECSITFMFLLNEFWTFDRMRKRSYRGLLSRFFKSHFVRLGGLTVGIAVLVLLYDFLNIWYVVANITGIGVGFFMNYVFESLFTWNIVEQ